MILSFFCLLALKENQNWKSTMTRLKHFNLNSNLTCNAHCTCRPEHNRIKEHNRVTWPSQTQTSAISEHANYTRHHLLLNKVKLINWDLTWDQALFFFFFASLLLWLERGKNNAWYIYLTSSQPPPNLHNLTSAWPVMLLANKRLPYGNQILAQRIFWNQF